MEQEKSYCLNYYLGIFCFFDYLEGGSKAIIFHSAVPCEQNKITSAIHLKFNHMCWMTLMGINNIISEVEPSLVWVLFLRWNPTYLKTGRHTRINGIPSPTEHAHRSSGNLVQTQI